ncbi:hypothetical protein LTR53_001019 [Teratosphaeriaceae sp. CCFEE 6253]|nr:hypothetical protein LTR53_001019 [Teratosphaeriaceae sp. CCFEE 6253]
MADMAPTTTSRDNKALPKTMKALQYSRPEQFEVVEIDVPVIGEDDVLVKIEACGVCGTDLHYHKGEFMAKPPYAIAKTISWLRADTDCSAGHEAVGKIVAVGRSVKTVAVGDRIAVDPMEPCRSCFYCVRGQGLLSPGGFAEYCRYPARHVTAIGDLPALEAVLIEPAACATHGIERMSPKVGSTVLLFGCGPTGMLLAQLLKLNGTANLTIASKPGPKLDLAKSLGIADSFVAISDDDAKSGMDALLQANPHGFDIVVEATGAPSVLEQSIFYVRKGGTLVVYGVYDDTAKISWPPMRIWTYEITVLASFCCTLKFPVVMEYLRTRKLDLRGIVNQTYRIEQWGECLEALAKQQFVKAAIVFGEC